MVVQTKRKLAEMREELLVQAEQEDSGSENEENEEVSEDEELTRWEEKYILFETWNRRGRREGSGSGREEDIDIQHCKLITLHYSNPDRTKHFNYISLI